MKRKDFLRNSIGFLGLAHATPNLIFAENQPEETLTCTSTNSETEGPFPTINPANYTTNNIIGDRTGVSLSISINIVNINANCSAYQNAIVDIWHCDKDGNYSQYGGTQMQSANYTNYNFLRGRQITDSNGNVTFTTIFPGWYQSRATHIHVHIYDPNGTSLLVTQIAFPEGTNSAVVQVNSATAYGYTKGMTGYTYNAQDNVFSDGTSNEMSTISGTISGGFALSHTIYVAGQVLSTSDFDSSSFGLAQNYPNPAEDFTVIPINLPYDSIVSLQLFDMSGKLVSDIALNNFTSGQNEILLERNGLSSGNYIYKVRIQNESGVFEESKQLIFK
ncbi:dioxygenase family protein [Flavobacterium sp. U410]